MNLLEDEAAMCSGLFDAAGGELCAHGVGFEAEDVAD